MHVFDSIDNVKNEFSKAVVAIGNFDGLHHGHRYLLKTAKDIADKAGLPLAVLTFNPHPRIFFNPDAPKFLLMSRDIKAERLAECGVDYTLFLPFNMQIASLSAEVFVKTVLACGMGAAHVVVGEDFGFGKKREGNISVLNDLGKQYGFGITAVPKLTDASHAYYGSSRIREALKKGDMKTIYDVTGHWHEIESEVVHGNKRGRTIGYPTANMFLHDVQEPAYGVYACMTEVKADTGVRSYPSVANFGVRPMFEVRTPLLEVHLFGFDGDLYGRKLRVRLISYLRGEMKFDSVSALIEQMDKDSAESIDIINSLININML